MKKLPIGIDNFEKVISQGYYYIDKTLFIKELIDSGAEATLIPRPRRFGKTLNLSMVRCFFEKMAVSRIDLFANLAIKNHDIAMKHQGQYPVIFLTFKFSNEPSWDGCLAMLKRILAEEYQRHSYLLDSDVLNDRERKEYLAIKDLKADDIAYKFSLKLLITYLSAYHNKNPIVLIDEYDVPIHGGYRHGYFDQVIAFMRSMLGLGLKNHDALHFAVLTGVLRVAKESIFTGLNNLEVCTFLDRPYSDKFGLLQSEVEQILSDYDIKTHIGEIQTWYNGYTSGDHKIYNPWSVINVVKQQGSVYPYWINTSSNDIIKSLIKNSDKEAKEDIEQLLSGQVLAKPISENIIYSDIQTNTEMLWSFLLFSGYLTFQNKRLVDTVLYADLLIPNHEVLAFYRTTILAWFKEPGGGDDYRLMVKSLINGDIETFEALFSELVVRSFSYFDISDQQPERFYHAFVLGLLVSLSDSYEIKSNRESGYGRYDVMLIPRKRSALGIIIEFKKVNTEDKITLEAAALMALKQIENKRYLVEIQSCGVLTILAIGIAFRSKMVAMSSKMLA